MVAMVTLMSAGVSVSLERFIVLIVKFALGIFHTTVVIVINGYCIKLHVF